MQYLLWLVGQNLLPCHQLYLVVLTPVFQCLPMIDNCCYVHRFNSIVVHYKATGSMQHSHVFDNGRFSRYLHVFSHQDQYFCQPKNSSFSPVSHPFPQILHIFLRGKNICAVPMAVKKLEKLYFCLSIKRYIMRFSRWIPSWHMTIEMCEQRTDA